MDEVEFDVPTATHELPAAFFLCKRHIDAAVHDGEVRVEKRGGHGLNEVEDVVCGWLGVFCGRGWAGRGVGERGQDGFNLFLEPLHLALPLPGHSLPRRMHLTPRRQIIEKDPTDAARLAPVRDIKVLVAPLLPYGEVPIIVCVCRALERVVKVRRVLRVEVGRC